MNNLNMRHLHELIVLSMEAAITDQQAVELKQLLESSETARREYVNFITTLSVLRDHDFSYPETILPAVTDLSDCSLNLALWNALLEQEQKAPQVEIQKPVNVSAAVQEARPAERSLIRYNKISALIAFASVAALFFMIGYVNRLLPDPKTSAAVVTDLIDTQWGDGDSLQQGAVMYVSKRPYELKDGLVKFQLNSGAEIIVESPARFRFQSENRMYADSGRFYAKVSDRAIGFTIETPSSSVIDLGTEFGVHILPSGDSEVYLYRGKASLIAGRQDQSKSSHILESSNARFVSMSGRVNHVEFRPMQFVQQIDSAKNWVWKGQNMDLTSLITGGNGFDAPQDSQGIDLLTGQMNWTTAEKGQQGARDYLSVPYNPYVDGVFVPNGENGPSQVSSAGHVYSFPTTSNAYYAPIGPRSEVAMVKPDNVRALTLKGCQAQSILCMHTNAGITFDLDAIRETLPENVAIKSFTAAYGISDTAIVDSGQSDPDADFFVLLDGQPKLCRKNYRKTEGAVAVEIPIQGHDRFLTLACTEATANAADWTLFADPALVLERQ
ncbi:MAG TPA: NPCBM/NEW2 domain-containing protein [Anaerohalosphaeraceae bacterium]|nr:NPCBM/NEW2 domain-containing protein [Anaerohalosphaeraceae bacterium]